MSESQSQMRELPQSTVRLLGSTQVITSVYSVVKELVENALDANATSLDVRLENYGLDKIEVRDNGDGIPSADVQFVAKRYHTSKLTSFSDLECLCTYGFRGEALGSLCTVADVSITTKTKEEDTSLIYKIGKEGEIIQSTPSHLGQGTTLTVLNLFKNLPVRRQMYNDAKKKKDELKKVETLMMSFGLICPSVRVTLRHDKSLVWQKNPVADLRASVAGTLGKSVLNQMEYKTVKESDPEVCVEMFVPRKASDPQVTSRSTSDRCFIYVNSRPVNLKDIERMLKQFYTFSHTCDGARFPICCVSIILPSGDIDVNLDPNKNRVYLHHQVPVANAIRTLLEEVYGPMESSDRNVKKKPVTDFSDDSVTMETSTFSDQSSLDLSPDYCLTKPKNARPNDSFTKITAISKSGSYDEHVPIYKVTKETNANGQSDNIVIDKVYIEKLEEYSRKEAVVLLADGSDQPGETVTEVNNSEMDVPKISLITKPVAIVANGNSIANCNSEKLEEKPSQGDVEIVQMQQACFDIVGDCFKDVLSDEETCEKTKTLVPIGGTQSSVFDDSLTDMLVNLDKTVKNAGSQSPDNTVPPTKSADESEVTPGAELWSKGQSLVGSGGKCLQPVALLSAGKRPLTSPSDSSPPRKKRSILAEEDQPTLYDMVSGLPVRRNDTGYSVFVKKTRPLVVAENPIASFDEVTDILKRKWDGISVDERQKYEQPTREILVCDLPLENTSSTKKLKQLGKRVKVNSKPVPAGISIKEQLILAAQKNKSRKSKVIPFSLADLQKTFTGQLSISQFPKTETLKLIGLVKSCGVWMCYRGNKICILNCHRVQETVLYHQLISDHVLTTSTQEQPIKLTPQNVGGMDRWKCLLSMETNRYPGDIHSYITDERIVDNGFKVRCYTDEETCVLQADIVAMTTFIPVYGVPDLAEILELICNSGANNVYQSRPLKLLNYLQGEAVRMARRLPRRQDREEVLEILDQMDTILPKGCQACLHDRPFCHAIYNMDDLPPTQATQEVAS